MTDRLAEVLERGLADLAGSIRELAEALRYNGTVSQGADPSLLCPQCGKPIDVADTQYGERRECVPCGLKSWGGKPLVDHATVQARKDARTALGPLYMRKRKDKVLADEVFAALGNHLGVEIRNGYSGLTKEQAEQVPGLIPTLLRDLKISDAAHREGKQVLQNLNAKRRSARRAATPRPSYHDHHDPDLYPGDDIPF